MMILSRTYLTCCLLGVGLFVVACGDDSEPAYDASVGTALPGGPAGTGSVGGGSATTGGTTGGSAAGTLSGGVAGTASGGIAGTASGGIAGTASGGIAGTASGGIAGTTSGGIAGTASGGIAGTTSGGIAGTTGGTGGTTAGTTGGTGGTTAGTTGGTTSGGGAMGGSSAGACTPPPAAKATATVWEPGGPNGDYTVIRPATLGEGGFMHPPIAWGNGVITTPTLYTELLDSIAKEGFVVIGDPGIAVTAESVRQGLEWLIEQGSGSGKYAGKLALNCAGTIGYSMGGGSAVGAGAHPAVKAVVSIHGLSDAAENVKGPLLITNSEGDGFVTKTMFSVPTYDRSRTQPTMLASHQTGDHLEPLGSGGADAEPSIAWLRYWIYGDQSAKDYFFGANCKLCSWPDVRRKNHPEWTGR